MPNLQRSIGMWFTQAAARRGFRHALLAWYDANRRDLPWRANRDPYRIWIAEIMLQQTRVAAVLEYYDRFLQRYPTVGDLAAARLNDVLAAWSGLGYYRRGRSLHAAAKQIVSDHAGLFPKTAEQWQTLPGVGRYTAAAIASIAFGECLAVVDGNVERVLSRLVGESVSGERSWELAEALLSPARPGDFNQAMMELGATICLPRAPHCLVCPVKHQCATRGELPASRRIKREKRDVFYSLNLRDGAVLLTRRPGRASVMAGMWELPEIVSPDGEPTNLFKLRHSITGTDYVVRVCQNGLSTVQGGRWFPQSRVSGLPLTGLARKILRTAGVI